MDEQSPMPSSVVAQAAQASQPKPHDVRDGVLLAQSDGTTDVIPVTFPPVPIRFQIYGAYRFAVGYREGDKGEPSGPYNETDALAIHWACLGVCWQGKDVNLPSFRDHGRDWVAYGEAVCNQLWFAGYHDAQQMSDAGNALFMEFMREAFAAHKRADKGFPTAKRG